MRSFYSRILVVFVGFVIVGALGAPGAHATNTSCGYNSGDHSLFMYVVFPVHIRYFVDANGEFKWEDIDSSTVTDCGDATVDNVSTASLGESAQTDPNIVLDFKRLWEPGFKTEGSGRSEIEISVNLGDGDNNAMELWGGPRKDHFVFGSDGMNYNGDNDVDIDSFMNVDSLLVKGGGKADLISTRGGHSTGLGVLGGPVMTLQGDAGMDSLLGGAGKQFLRGIDGADKLLGGDGPDILFADAGDDVVKGEDGNDELDGMGGKDTMLGARGKDDLEGGPGPDALDGGPNNDHCDGGGGADSLTHCES